MKSTNGNENAKFNESEKSLDNAKTKDGKANKNCRNKNKGNRGSNRNNRSSNAKDFKAPDKINDPSWYVINDSLLQTTAAMTFGRPAGAIIKPDYTTEEDATLFQSAKAGVTPGVMALRVAPVIGKSNADGISAIDQAANILYTKTRAAVANNLPYTKSDQMMYIMAADSAYQMLAYMQRAYGAMTYFNAMNKYYPEVLISAMDLDYDSLLQNRNNLYTFIDLYARRLEAVFCPDSMPIFVRHYWLYQNIWADNVTDKSQLYIYTPAGFYIREAVEASDFQSQLIFTEWAGKKHTYEELVKQAWQMLDALLLPDDLVRINGDLKATLGTGLVPNHIPIDYAPTIAYSPEVLSQIENSVISNMADLDVTEDISNDKIVFNPMAVTKETSQSVKNAFRMFMHGKKFINFHTQNPTPAQMVVSTRNLIYTKETNYVECCGTELILSANMWYFSPVGTPTHVDITSVLSVNAPESGSVILDTISKVIMLGQFDWAPAVHLFQCWHNSEASSDVHCWEGCTAEIDTWTLLSKDEFAQMNNVALLRLFGV